MGREIRGAIEKEIMNFEFSRKFYTSEAISAAIKAYGGCAEFKVQENGETMIVSIDKIATGIDAQTLFGEFGNRVLSEMV